VDGGPGALHCCKSLTNPISTWRIFSKPSMEVATARTAKNHVNLPLNGRTLILPPGPRDLH